MKVKFNDHYTSITKYGGSVEGCKFITEVTYSSLEKKWAVLDPRWIFEPPKKKDKAEKRIKEMVKGFFRNDWVEEMDVLYDRIFKKGPE